MTCLLVVAHPVAGSLNQHLSRVAETAARDAGLPLRRLDLYAEGFDPCLTAAERPARYPSPAEIPDPVIAAHASALLEAEVLILVFPTWWYGFPAILKGWFDRIWRPGIAFDHAGPDKERLLPRLDRLRHVVAITTMGSPPWVDYLLLRQPLRRALRWSILAPCAPRARLHWLALHGAEGANARKVARFSSRIRRTVAAVACAHPALRAPRG